MMRNKMGDEGLLALEAVSARRRVTLEVVVGLVGVIRQCMGNTVATVVTVPNLKKFNLFLSSFFKVQRYLMA